MGMAETVAKMRFKYHLEAIEMNNVLNQLGIRSNAKADECAKRHFMTLIEDVMPRLGYDTSSLFVENEEEGSE